MLISLYNTICKTSFWIKKFINFSKVCKEGFISNQKINNITIYPGTFWEDEKIIYYVISYEGFKHYDFNDEPEEYWKIMKIQQNRSTVFIMQEKYIKMSILKWKENNLKSEI